MAQATVKAWQSNDFVVRIKLVFNSFKIKSYFSSILCSSLTQRTSLASVLKIKIFFILQEMKLSCFIMKIYIYIYFWKWNHALLFPNAKKTKKTHLKKISYISWNGTFKLKRSKSSLYFLKTKPVLYFLKRNHFLHFWKRNPAVFSPSPRNKRTPPW